MFKRKVKSIAELLPEFLRKEGLETPLQQKRLIMSWDSVVGENIAAYCGEKFIKNQTLYVKIENAALRADLTMSRATLVRRLNEQVGAQVIADIGFYYYSELYILYMISSMHISVGITGRSPSSLIFWKSKQIPILYACGIWARNLS